MPETTSEESSGASEKKTLVRGADGALYLLTEDAPPQKLNEGEAGEVMDILREAEDRVARAINQRVPRITLNCTHAIRISLPEIFTD